MYVKEQLISSMSDLPEKSKLSGISKVLVKRVNRLWRKEKQMVSYVMEKYRNNKREWLLVLACTWIWTQI